MRNMRDLEQMLDTEAAKAGAKFCGIERRSKHLMATFARGGETRKVFMSCTPGDYRAVFRNRTVIRRVINEMPEAA